MDSFVDANNHPRCDTTAVRYLPSWFPGAQFHRFAKKVREDAYNAIHLPFEHVADAFKVVVFAVTVIDSAANFGAQLGGIIESSIVSTYLEDFERINKGDIDKEVISTIAGMVYIGMYPKVFSTWFVLSVSYRHVGDGAHCGRCC